MPTMRDPMDADPLARRLSTLSVPGTDGVLAGVLDRYRSARPPRRGHRALLLSLAAAGLVLGVALSPLAQAATSPVTTALLHLAGIDANDAATLASGPGAITRATSSGHTITVLGAYGDQFRVVVFLGGDGRPIGDVGPAELTDETGRSLGLGRQLGRTADGVPLEFSGLPPGDHRLTLRVDSLWEPPPPGLSRFVQPTFVRGAWTLRFPLAVHAARPNAVPASGDLGRVHVVIDEASGGRNAAFLQLEVTGATLDELEKIHETGDEAHPATPGPGRFTVQILDPGGHEVSPATVAASDDGTGKGQPAGAPRPLHVTWRAYLPTASPGTYRLVVTFEGRSFTSRFDLG